ncbi:MAG: DUF2061 domain-containing protein [Candidatus Paceibacteria bacterium]
MTVSQSLRFVKSFCWAVLGMALTVLIALVVTNEPTTSVGVGVAEFVFTYIFFYLHELVWDGASNLFQFSLHDHRASLAQALSWRVTGTVLTIGIVFVLADAIQVGIGEVVVKVVIYYGYARLWLWIIRKVEERRRGPLARIQQAIRFLNPVRRFF